MALLIKEVFIASDHAGVELKSQLIESFKQWPWQDCGPLDTTSVDYPDFADKVCSQVCEPGQWGVLICGSGQGMAMRANKYPQIRAAMVYSVEIAELARAHNNANVICLGARFLEIKGAINLLQRFFSTPFEGSRHAKRVEKIAHPLLKGAYNV